MFEWLFNNTPLLYFTQSLWRDEAFSILVSERPISSFIGKLSFEPPVYYILLHIWMKLFGNSEISARSLSLLGFSLATIVVIFWAEELFKKHWVSWFVPLLFFFNPMLLYYGFEIRTYGWYMFFATLSLFAYTSKKYWLLLIANVLAFYTHSYAILLIMVEIFHYLFIQKKLKLSLSLLKEKAIHSFTLSLLIIAPWMAIIIHEATRLKESWYFPVDLQLVGSVLGNLYTSYDGTPGGLWRHTLLLSLILLGLFYLAFRNKKERSVTSFLLVVIFVPLILVVGISFIKPLFVNRYLIFVPIATVILLGYALLQIKQKNLQKITAVALLLLSLGINVFLPAKKAKTDVRTVFAQANSIRNKNDVLFVTSPLIFFEAVYYTKDRNNVYLYNPTKGAFPWYVGDMIFSNSQMAYKYPEYPTRAIVVNPDKSITIEYRIHSK